MKTCPLIQFLHLNEFLNKYEINMKIKTSKKRGQTDTNDKTCFATRVKTLIKF